LLVSSELWFVAEMDVMKIKGCRLGGVFFDLFLIYAISAAPGEFAISIQFVLI